MENWLKALIAAACVAVIGAVAIYFYNDVKQKRQEREFRAGAEAASKDAQYRQCKDVVGAWDLGNRQPAQRQYGSSAESGIFFCRSIVEIYEHQQSIELKGS